MVTGGPYINEDINKNLTLDPGEDTGPPVTDCPVLCCPGDCEITPPSSASGALPQTVITDASGVANFDLVYLKSSAVWIDAEITASTLVLGTETRSTLEFRLPYAVPDKVHLPDSPYGIGTLTITASAGAGGSIAPSGPVLVDYLFGQIFTITPDACYNVLDVEVDGESEGPVTEYIFLNVVENHTIHATFEIDTFTIAANAGLGGSITPSGAVSVDCGTNESFTITPDACYHVLDVVVDGASVGPVLSHTFNNVTADHTIAATFEIDTYTITASAGANGNIFPSGAVSVDCGSDQSFTITPAAGYTVESVTLDTGPVGLPALAPDEVYTYDFSNVTGDRTISATFYIP